MDLYRISGSKPGELLPLNLKRVFETSVALIEWPQRLGDTQLPTNRLEIFISILSHQKQHHHVAVGSNIDDEINQVRRAKITPYGGRWRHRLRYAVDQGFLDDLLE